MRTFHWLAFLGASFFVAASVGAQQSAGISSKASQDPFRPIATVKEIMDLIVDPSSKIVFDAVSSKVTAQGVEEKAPKDDKEWAMVRAQALLLVESSNLLLMPGRHITQDSASPSSANTGVKGQEYELTPREIEVFVAKNPVAWTRLARALNVAANTSLKAATAKDAQALQASGEAVDNACENCHLKFWYPDQEKLLGQAKGK